ncbi:MAG: acetyl-CoA carboxylase biotin carboxyl carrier protein subunit [Bacteroidota bacterium]
MSTVYRAAIDAESYQVCGVSGSEIRLNDHKYSYDLILLELGLYSLLLNGKVHTLKVLQGPDTNRSFAGTENVSADGSAHIMISAEGREYSVQVDDERSWLLRSYLSKVHATTGTTTVRAPMPGLIVRVEVKNGDHIQPGHGLIVLEAMKMENEIRSLTGGVVKEIHVEIGKPVEKGEPLVTLAQD